MLHLQFSMPFIAEIDIKSSGSGYERHLEFFYTCLNTKTTAAKQSVYHGIISLTRPDHALACLQMIRKKGTDKRLQCQCHMIVSVPANAMGQCHCLLLNEPKVHKVWIHIYIGLILSTILNLLFIFQQDGRA